MSGFYPQTTEHRDPRRAVADGAGAAGFEGLELGHACPEVGEEAAIHVHRLVALLVGDRLTLHVAVETADGGGGGGLGKVDRSVKWTALRSLAHLEAVDKANAEAEGRVLLNLQIRRRPSSAKP